MQISGPSIRSSSCCSQLEHVNRSPLPVPGSVMILHRSRRFTTPGTSDDWSCFGMSDNTSVCVCVCVDPVVWCCGCTMGLTMRCSLQWVPVWCTIMTCQKYRPLKTRTIHRGHLTKWILTGAKTRPRRPLHSIIYSTGLLSNLTRNKKKHTKIERGSVGENDSHSRWCCHLFTSIYCNRVY